MCHSLILCFYFSRKAAERIGKVNRNMKLLLITRDPTKRLVSDYTASLNEYTGKGGTVHADQQTRETDVFLLCGGIWQILVLYVDHWHSHLEAMFFFLFLVDISFKSLVYTFVLILEGYLSFINLLFRPLIPLFCLLWILEVIVDHTVRMLITCMWGIL